ncbi:MAG TPA: fatty acyl-AMP ligase, partial [Rhizobiales bacterium]|nr:fatty acyl-AMP ligase [Hyphomicrobiales bacterium]
DSLIREAAGDAGAGVVLTHDELHALPASGDVAPFKRDEVAYIQYSSGSTSAPKGVLITQKAIIANAHGIMNHGLDISENDRAFSWLPFYHDMGLVGFCLTPMLCQMTVDYLATPAFARRPALWLKLMSDNQSTIAYAPSFGYDLAARRVNGGASELDLSHWRAAGIGGDMVRADMLSEFAERMKAAGFDEKAFVPSYGMAESTLAISFDTLGKGIVVDNVDRAKMKLSQKAVPVSGREILLKPERVRSFVACGKPMPGHQLEVRGNDGKVLGEREVGHVMIKGPSLMAGYYHNEEATRAVIGEDGFLDTGDMGYLLDGQIVLTGRAKDLILHNGRNIWPQDIEWSAEQLDELRSGDVAAFGVEDENGEEQVTVLVQCRLRDSEKREALRRDVARVVHQSAGVECNVVLVPPRSLPFTSSGKLSRAGAKKDYLAGIICEIASDSQTPQMMAAAS